MATLSGNKVKDTYTSLLKLQSNGITSTLKAIEDGAGVDSALKLSTDTVEVDGTLSFTAAPTTDSSELTALMVDASNNVVKRELDSSAFGGASNTFKTISVAGQSNVVADSSSDTLTLAAGGNITLTTNSSTDTVTIAAVSTLFSNPMFVLRPSAAHTLTNTASTPAQGAVNNNSTTSSYLFNDSSNVHLQTSSTTTGAVTIERAGAIKIDVNFILEITSSNTDVTIRVYRKPSGGAAAAIQTIVRSNISTGNMAIGFSLFTHCADDEDIYYEVGKNSSGGGSLTTQSTFAITKLD
jgi:hypothetical protein